MKTIGKTLLVLCACALLLTGHSALAAVSASLDRDRIAMGDTLRLTLTATDGEEISAADLRPLLADFEILQRSTSSNTNIVNGRRTHTKQLLIDISPRREGRLKIPPMRIGQGASNSLAVTVSAAPDISTGGQSVLFEAVIDRNSVYVQGQVILTLRLQQAINLDGRSISELELDNAFVKALEQKSFQRTIDGRQWLVHEVRYAIFPEHSGTLEIPQQSFTGRVREGRRSFFDQGGSGRLLRRSSKALSIEVLPRPDSFPGTNWLPARQLKLVENWSTPPEQLRAGESATRTIQILGEGVQGAQLPPVLFPPNEGLKFYPDQPEINDQEVASGLLGARQDSTAVVPTRAGNWSIPEIRIPWWDTESRQLRYAVLPGREITVAAAEPDIVAGQPPAANPNTATIPTATAAPLAGTALLWQILGIVSTTGWLLTLVYLWRTRTKGPVESAEPPAALPEKQAYKALLSACSGNDAHAARAAIIAWTAILSAQQDLVTLEQVISQFNDAQLASELQVLDCSLYSPGQDDWRGTGLGECVQRLRGEQRKGRDKGNLPMQLYPQAA
jgi:hypothetical protein